jgi:hypothetical protein
MCPLRFLSTFCRIGAMLVLILRGAVSQAWTQSTTPTGCLDAPPSFTPFEIAYYVTREFDVREEQNS